MMENDNIENESLGSFQDRININEKELEKESYIQNDIVNSKSIDIVSIEDNNKETVIDYNRVNIIDNEVLDGNLNENMEQELNSNYTVNIGKLGSNIDKPKASKEDYNLSVTRIDNSTDLDRSNAIDRLNKFIVLHTEQQIDRIINLTKKMMDLEDRYYKQALTSYDMDDMNKALTLIQKSIDTVFTNVTKLTSDPKLIQLLQTNINTVNNYTNQVGSIDLSSNPVFSILNNKESREKILKTLDSIAEVKNDLESGDNNDL